MTLTTTFTFRTSEQERRLLEGLAQNLQRSQSDTVRLLIREANAKHETAVFNKPQNKEVQDATSPS
jgi:hypothetical protein